MSGKIRLDYKRLSQRVICQAIKDLGDTQNGVRRRAIIFAKSNDFHTHLQRAGYPSELSSAIEEMMLRSKAQRRGLSREIIEVLEKFWEG